MAANAAIRLVDSAGPVDPGITSASGERGEGTRLSFENFKRHYDAEPDRKWQVEVLDKLTVLVNMPAGWDGYRAPAIRRDAAMFAVEVLQRAMRPRTPAPQVVPSSVGGVQLEWHERGLDLELHVAAPYECEIWYEDHRSGTAVSKGLSSDFSLLGLALDNLTNR